jgi:hypothetical protein
MMSRREHVGYHTARMIALLIASLLVQAPTRKVEVVSVTGCLRERADSTWMLVAATDPVPSVANQAQGDDIPKTAPAGKNTFRLIGVSEFSFPQHRDRTMVIRGLLIKDKVGRINVTSAVEAVASCVAGAPK